MVQIQTYHKKLLSVLKKKSMFYMFLFFHEKSRCLYADFLTEN